MKKYSFAACEAISFLVVVRLVCVCVCSRARVSDAGDYARELDTMTCKDDARSCEIMICKEPVRGPEGEAHL